MLYGIDVRPTGHNHTGLHKYQYKDPLRKNGLYYYRLRLTDDNGHITYAPVTMVNASPLTTLFLCLNPATHYLSVVTNPPKDDMAMVNLRQQPVLAGS